VSVFALPTPLANGGLPLVVRQTASLTSSSGGNIVLASTPTPGSVLLLGVGSIQSNQQTPTGGGATWQRVGRVTLTSGSQVECSLWMGVVGQSPSATSNIAWSNNGNGFLAEVSRGLSGRVLKSTSNLVGNQQLDVWPISAFRPPAYPGSRMGARVAWYVSRGATGVFHPQTAPKWYDSGVVVSNVRYSLMIWQYTYGTIASFSAPTGNTNNHAVVFGIIA